MHLFSYLFVFIFTTYWQRYKNPYICSIFLDWETYNYFIFILYSGCTDHIQDHIQDHIVGVSDSGLDGGHSSGLDGGVCGGHSGLDGGLDGADQ
jgi:hypothetical protein